MSKKIFLYAFVMALIVTLVGSSVAYAASGTPDITATAVFDNRYGKVTAVFPDHFIIKNLSGVKQTILLTSATKVYSVKGIVKPITDVQMGSWIFAAGVRSGRRTLTAKNIVLTGATYSGAKYWSGVREWGTVTSVDPVHGIFFMNTSKSGLVRVLAYSPTVFLNSQVNSVSKITVGMKALVAGPLSSNGIVMANIVDAFTPSQ